MVEDTINSSIEVVLKNNDDVEINKVEGAAKGVENNEDMLNSFMCMGLNNGSQEDINASQSKRSGRQKQRLKIKSKSNHLATRGGTQWKEKGSGVSRSGVEEIIGSFNVGDSIETMKYDMFSLKKREKSGVIKKVSKNSCNQMATTVLHVVAPGHAGKINIGNIDVPPDLQNKQRVSFSFPMENSHSNGNFEESGDKTMRDEIACDGEEIDVVKDTPY